MIPPRQPFELTAIDRVTRRPPVFAMAPSAADSNAPCKQWCSLLQQVTVVRRLEGVDG